MEVSSKFLAFHTHTHTVRYIAKFSAMYKFVHCSQMLTRINVERFPHINVENCHSTMSTMEYQKLTGEEIAESDGEKLRG